MVGWVVGGPASRRRRMRALPWSWDSDEGRNVVRRMEAHVDSDEEPLLPPSSPPEEVIRALEADLCSPPRASKRVVFVPQSQGGTPASIQDAPRDVAFHDSCRRCASDIPRQFRSTSTPCSGFQFTDGTGRDVAQSQKASTKSAIGFGGCAGGLQPEFVVHHMELDKKIKRRCAPD